MIQTQDMLYLEFGVGESIPLERNLLILRSEVPYSTTMKNPLSPNDVIVIFPKSGFLDGKTKTGPCFTCLPH